MKGKQKTGVHTPVRIKISESVRVSATHVPRRCCNAGYSAQHHGQDQYNHSYKNTSRENQILHIQVVYQSFIRLLGYDLCLQRSI